MFVKEKKVEYFLNAVHYCLWLNEKKIGDFVGKIVYVLLAPIPKYLFTKAYRKKYHERLSKEQKNLNAFFYNRKNSFSIGWADHWFGYFYSGYSISLSFVIIGIAERKWGELNAGMVALLIAIPIGICAIPAYNAVFVKDRYLKYFKKFEKKDERWHEKWKWITFLFVIGGIATAFMGLAVMGYIERL